MNYQKVNSFEYISVKIILIDHLLVDIFLGEEEAGEIEDQAENEEHMEEVGVQDDEDRVDLVPPIRKRKILTEEQRVSVISMSAKGLSNRAIGKKMKVSHQSIGRILQRWNTDGLVKDRKRSGRRRKTDTRTDLRMVRIAKKDRSITTEEIRKNIGAQVCSRTISNRLKEGGLKSRIATKKPLISEINRKKRLEWCKAHQHWTYEQWSKVLFSDESPFSVRCKRARRIWVTPKEGLSYKNCQATVKHGKKINVWGCFAADGVGNLCQVNGILEQKQYRDILLKHMIPSAGKLFDVANGEKWIFQQDNDPKHTADLTEEWFYGFRVTVLDWPAQSPDLNPIENLWSELDRRLKDRKTNTKEDLFRVLEEGWNNLPKEYLKKLVESMPRRIKACIKNKGFATKY